jgi:hypothetical protein
MRVEPYSVPMLVEFIWCENGRVELYDGSSTPTESLPSKDSSFMRFCKGLDPNRYYISALVPQEGPHAEANRDLFFRARDAARSVHIHMQAQIEPREALQRFWEHHKLMKKAKKAEDASSSVAKNGEEKNE